MSGLNELKPWIADGLVVLGCVVMSIGVFGMISGSDIYERLHAASKGVFVGAIGIGAASLVTGQGAIVARVALIALFLLLTTPVASHAIGRSAFATGEPMAAPGGVDESKRLPPGASSAE